jgi:hypothetical protein
MRKFLILGAIVAVVISSGVLKRGGSGHASFQPYDEAAVAQSTSSGKAYVVFATADW